MFDYLLTMTTSGRRDCFESTVESFVNRVRPLPLEVFIYDDGLRTGAADLIHTGEVDFGMRAREVTLEPARRRIGQAGFCKATARCWQAAAESSLGWHFHLEDDFLFTRSVDLRDLAHVLELEPHVAQMAMMRDAVNDAERDAGGIYQHRRGDYTLRGAGSGSTWLEHHAYFTTNPALQRTSLARAFPWPTDDQCEGMYGIRMRQAVPATTFGAWGNGDPWVRHIGEREGFGY